MLIDQIDQQILLSLLREGRIQIKILAEKVGLSPPAVAERIRRLEAADIIKGYSARLDLSKLGYGIEAFVRVSAQADHGDSLIRTFRKALEVIEIYKVTGEDSYLLHVVAQSIPHLQAVIESISVGVRLSTSIVLATEAGSQEAIAKLLARISTRATER